MKGKVKNLEQAKKYAVQIRDTKPETAYKKPAGLNQRAFVTTRLAGLALETRYVAVIKQGILFFFFTHLIQYAFGYAAAKQAYACIEHT